MISKNTLSDVMSTRDEDEEQAQTVQLISQPNHDKDLEQALPAPTPIPPSISHEHTISTRKKLVAVTGYFCCNVGLTIYNKLVLGAFPFPWLLTALHAAASSIGCLIMSQRGSFTTTKLTSRETFSLLAFSILFTINIAISNVSLAMVSIPFHQVIRATTPLFTTLIYRVLYSRSYPLATYLSLIPTIAGVALATYGDYTFTTLGLILTFLGVLLAALKTIVTNRLMTGSLSLTVWEILFRMSPLACVQSLLYAVAVGEVHSLSTLLFHHNPSSSSSTGVPNTQIPSLPHLALVLMGNGALAFLLNVSSFRTNKIAGALTMTVCANVKQCLTIVLGIVLFNVHLTMLNAWGIVVTVAGGVLYSFVELDGKRRSKGSEKMEKG